MAVRIDDVRDLTAGLPRSYEVLVRGRIKFRVGRIVYLAFSRDETLMGFAFPKEEREAALETYPDRFLRPRPSDMRYQWLVVRLDAIDKDELASHLRRLAHGRAEEARFALRRSAPGAGLDVKWAPRGAVRPSQVGSASAAQAGRLRKGAERHGAAAEAASTTAHEFHIRPLGVA